jgi:hypothetical protein
VVRSPPKQSRTDAARRRNADNARRYYWRNRERILQTNRAERAAYKAKWAKENSDRLRKKRHEDYLKRGGKETARAYYQAKRIKILTARRAHKDKLTDADKYLFRIKRRDYYWKNRERLLAQQKRRRDANRERYSAHRRKKRQQDGDKERQWAAARYRRYRAIGKNLRPDPKKRSAYRAKIRWIVKRLTQMARDDGIWDLLKKEYENGQRSL